MRIGLLADIHTETVSDSVLRALEGSDLIFVCGDLGSTTKVLDVLQAVAPVKALRVGHAPTDEDSRLIGETHVIEAEGVRIGLMHEIDRDDPKPVITLATEPPFVHQMQFPQEMPLREFLTVKFGVPVDVVAFGGTHMAFTCFYQGVLFVNAGSPTLPAQGAAGALEAAVLDIHHGVVSPRIVDLRSL